MQSVRHNSLDDRVLDAAAETVRAVGWRRTTLTDVARRAGVSRMTVYRHWPDAAQLMADLMTREWSEVAVVASLVEQDAHTSPERFARVVLDVAESLRTNELFRKVVEADPDLLLPYLLQRPGRTQRAMLDIVTDMIGHGQADGALRDGDPATMARAVVLASQGYVVSGAAMAGDVPVTDLAAELRELVRRYVTP